MTENNLRITKQFSGDVGILILNGSIDINSVSQLKDAIMELIDNNILKIVINLKEVERMSSTAIGVMIGRLKTLRNINGDIRMCGMNDNIKKIFNMLGADKIFKISDTEKKAIEEFK